MRWYLDSVVLRFSGAHIQLCLVSVVLRFGGAQRCSYARVFRFIGAYIVWCLNCDAQIIDVLIQLSQIK